jgi:hypothetical protein
MIESLTWSSLGLLIFCIAGLGIASTLNQWEIVDAVNAHLPEQERFEPLGWWFGKSARLSHEYRRLFPSGTLLRRQGTYALLMNVCSALVPAVLGFFFVAALLLAVGCFVTWVVYFERTG